MILNFKNNLKRQKSKVWPTNKNSKISSQLLRNSYKIITLKKAKKASMICSNEQMKPKGNSSNNRIKKKMIVIKQEQKSLKKKFNLKLWNLYKEMKNLCLKLKK